MAIGQGGHGFEDMEVASVGSVDAGQMLGFACSVVTVHMGEGDMACWIGMDTSVDIMVATADMEEMELLQDSMSVDGLPADDWVTVLL